MTLPIKPPYEPMESLHVDSIPTGDNWQYEPKWDGFRCIMFRDGAEVYMQSKSGKPLGRYFPDVVAAGEKIGAVKFVLDGEIVAPVDGALSFEHLQLRLHPAASRVKKLADAHPALYVVFDMLVDEEGKSLVGTPLAERRAKLEEFARNYFRDEGTLRLSPATNDAETAGQWLKNNTGGLDGVVAKRTDLEYRTGARDGMQKIKAMRTADCVVGGFRYATKGGVVGSLLLGLYDENGVLHHIGYTSGIKTSEKKKMTEMLEKLRKGTGFTGSAPGGPSRWSTERSAEWEPLRPELVVEVEYDHYSEGRFRHGTRLVRFRPDKAPGQCTLDQIVREGRNSLKML